MAILVHRSHVPTTRGSTQGQNIHAKLCEKKQGACLPCVVKNKLSTVPTTLEFGVIACLGLKQQEALVLLVSEIVLGQNHAFVKAELLAGAVVAAKEGEHSVKHGPHFVNLVRLVYGIICLIDQVQEASEGDVAAPPHDFPKNQGCMR